jgi:3-isopropylmalate/(R)-2-methylmalate dehydratase small subunit
MKKLVKMTGLVVPLDRSNVDTDQIIPKQFLKRTERTGFGKFLFYDWRYNSDGTPNPNFILNQPQYQGASILLARQNFGCGSSREHAPWALLDYGLRVIIAPSFADIFFNNCFQNGMLPIKLDEKIVDDLFERAAADNYQLTVDLQECKLTDAQGLCIPFTVNPARRQMLLDGQDDIDRTLQFIDKIVAYEKEREGVA